MLEHAVQAGLGSMHRGWREVQRRCSASWRHLPECDRGRAACRLEGSRSNQKACDCTVDPWQPARRPTRAHLLLAGACHTCAADRGAHSAVLKCSTLAPIDDFECEKPSSWCQRVCILSQLTRYRCCPCQSCIRACVAIESILQRIRCSSTRLRQQAAPRGALPQTATAAAAAAILES